MIALWMAVFFTVAALGAWLVMFPAARDGVWADADRLRARMRAVVVRWQSRAGARAADGSCALGAVTARVGRSLRRHRWLLAGIVPVLIVPPLLILQARQQVVLDGFDDHAVVAADDHVIALLRGERLAPPPDSAQQRSSTSLRGGPGAVPPAPVRALTRQPPLRRTRL
jgi:peptidoglycan L-alanyl-D-glutamate endopeptidase CwlK